MKARDLFFGLVACAVAAVVAGCASSAPDQKIQRKEALLSTCGFKVVNAATPQQLQQMQMLPPDRIFVVNRGGTRY